jgi:hypothetical protein
MSRADGKRKRAIQSRKHERERLRDERKKAKLEKRTGAAAEFAEKQAPEGEGRS